MTAVIIIVALLALAGFLFWLAEHFDAFALWVTAAVVLGFALYNVGKVLS